MKLYIVVALFIVSSVSLLKARDIEIYNTTASVNQFLVIDFKNPIVGITIAQNRYGRMQIEQLSNKSLVILLNKNIDDNNEAIYFKAFQGRILLSDDKCNKYLLNLKAEKDQNTTKPKHVIITPKYESKNTCEEVVSDRPLPYKHSMMLN